MVFDCFTFLNEFDLLELRLNILDPFVDYFVLVESHQTFLGNPKPLYFEENKERFAKWQDKIIHLVQPDGETSNPFERHWWCYELQEKYLMSHGNPEDIAMCSDLDEIWNPEILNINDDLIHSTKMLNYCYYLNYRSSEDWTGTLMTKIKNIYEGYQKTYRSVKPNLIENGGWHFTNMGGFDQIMKKITSYDHGHEINPEWVREHLSENMDEGFDFLGRPLDYKGEPYRFWISEENWPGYLKEHKEDYRMLCR